MSKALLHEQHIIKCDEGDIQQEEASTSEAPWKKPKITLRQTEPNCWQVILNKEEQELIDEFWET